MNALEFYRLRNDLTQEELGKRIGVSKQTICKWEKQTIRLFQTADLSA